MGEGKRFNEEANESDKLALARETRAMKRNLIALSCGCVMTLTIINQRKQGYHVTTFGEENKSIKLQILALKK